jgi:hypothetical protein
MQTLSQQAGLEPLLWKTAVAERKTPLPEQGVEVSRQAYRSTEDNLPQKRIRWHFRHNLGVFEISIRQIDAEVNMRKTDNAPVV